METPFAEFGKTRFPTAAKLLLFALALAFFGLWVQSRKDHSARLMEMISDSPVFSRIEKGTPIEVVDNEPPFPKIIEIDAANPQTLFYMINMKAANDPGSRVTGVRFDLVPDGDRRKLSIQTVRAKTTSLGRSFVCGQSRGGLTINPAYDGPGGVSSFQDEMGYTSSGNKAFVVFMNRDDPVSPMPLMSRLSSSGLSLSRFVEDPEQYIRDSSNQVRVAFVFTVDAMK